MRRLPPSQDISPMADDFSPRAPGWHATTILMVREEWARRHRRRRPGQHRPDGRQGQRPQGAPSRQGRRHRGLRRRDRRRVHPVRAAGGQARAISRPAARAPASSWPRTGAPTAICGASRRCCSSPTRATAFVLSGSGDVLEPEGDESARRWRSAPAAITRSPRPARCMPMGLDAEEIVRRSMRIAAEICVYTNPNLIVESL